MAKTKRIFIMHNSKNKKQQSNTYEIRRKTKKSNFNAKQKIFIEKDRNKEYS